MCTVKKLRRRFSFTGIHHDVDLLLAESLKKSTTFLDAHPDYRLRLGEYFRFRWFVFCYRRGYSVAAVVGHKEFFGLDFAVNTHVLIPRPETELMVENTLPLLSKDTVLVDVGTGSGCVPVSILKTASIQPATTIAIDISSRALCVAKKNAARHGVAIQFLCGNLLKPFLKTYKLQPTSSRLVITANLPYLTREQMASEPSIQREPATALVAGDGGLALYQELFAQIKTLAGQMPVTVLCEIDPSQNERVRALAKKISPTARVEIKKDLAGRDRLVIITVSSQPKY